jgi:hypothetical protein
VATLCDSISHRLTLTVVIGIAGTSTKKTREGEKKTLVFGLELGFPNLAFIL